MSIKDYPATGTNACTSGTLASSANTADQVIATYTVPTGKTFFLGTLLANVRLTTFATTATNFGTISLMVNGSKIVTFTVVAGPGVLNSPLFLEPGWALTFAAGDVIKIVCTPSAATAMTWDGSLIGFIQ